MSRSAHCLYNVCIVFVYNVYYIHVLCRVSIYFSIRQLSYVLVVFHMFDKEICMCLCTCVFVTYYLTENCEYVCACSTENGVHVIHGFVTVLNRENCVCTIHSACVMPTIHACVTLLERELCVCVYYAMSLCVSYCLRENCVYMCNVCVCVCVSAIHSVCLIRSVYVCVILPERELCVYVQ